MTSFRQLYTVHRQSFWDNRQDRLTEGLAHRVRSEASSWMLWQ
jgi:hypothetical protein